MGYRLCIEQIQKEPQLYGTKLYGYVTDVTKLKSFQWLAEHNKIDPEEDRYCWEGYASMDIRMTANEFRDFIDLYAEDLSTEYNYQWNHFHEDEVGIFMELYESDNDKIVSWG